MSQSMAQLPPGSYDDHGSMILGSVIGLLVITVLTVLLRCWVRLKVTPGWQWDDTSIIIALALVIVGNVMLVLSVKEGNGKHIWMIPPSQIPDLTKWSLLYGIVLFTASLFIKTSIAFFILRLIGKPGIRRKTKMTLYVIIVAMTIATIILVALWMTVCSPVQKVWNRDLPGTCFPQPVIHSVAYAQSAFAIASDLLLTISPICIFWTLQISRKKKVGICALMSVGLAATITSIMKNVAITKISNGDFTYDSALSEILGLLECSLGVIAACIPTFVRIFKTPRAERYWYRITRLTSKTSNSSGSNGSKERGQPLVPPAPSTLRAPKDPYSFDDLEDRDSSYEAAHVHNGSGIGWERSYVVKYEPPMVKEV